MVGGDGGGRRWWEMVGDRPRYACRVGSWWHVRVVVCGTTAEGEENAAAAGWAWASRLLRGCTMYPVPWGSTRWASRLLGGWGGCVPIDVLTDVPLDVLIDVLVDVLIDGRQEGGERLLTGRHRWREQ